MRGRPRKRPDGLPARVYRKSGSYYAVRKSDGRYAESYRAGWRRRGADVRAAFRAFDIEQVNTAAIMDFLEDNWANKATMKRAMKAWLTPSFDLAILRGHLIVNPCRALKVKKTL